MKNLTFESKINLL